MLRIALIKVRYKFKYAQIKLNMHRKIICAWIAGNLCKLANWFSPSFMREYEKYLIHHYLNQEGYYHE